MPPSPALRFSPGREPKADNHKRGRSLEGGLLFKEKDDDLALFNDMQTREREDFLLQSTDDFEDTFSSKLRHFSDLKLGISIPVRGESSELLNADVEKNDYDWLLTPPDTPLFPSLDDEPPPVSVAPRGRPRSQPITISRSSTMEKSYRSSRGSASPNRLSPSPRSVNSTSLSQSRGRPSSASHSSPTHSQRSATLSQRPSPPPSKSSTPAVRSSTPTPQRTSVSGTRGTSPIRTNRGNSVSPKIRAWQSNIPGFSSEAPPNLRTSLIDRPASYVRGSSPASRNGRESSSKFGRQSMSPTASRSVSSSHSQDRDRISSHSKGSIASSGDDDADSLQSVHVGSLDRLATKRIGAFPNSRSPVFSKKPARILSPSSAPKRSFDSALRQMDHRKSPQNMFRPLLSSVPSSTFYAGKVSSAHRPLISRNSSVTTSSNTSSDQGTSVALETDATDHQQEDMAIESSNVLDPDIQEEVFAFDKVDLLDKDAGHDIDDIDRDPAVEGEPGDMKEFSHPDVGVETSSTSGILCVRADNSEADSLEITKLCSRCGCRYRVVETLENDVDLCPDCCREENHVVDVMKGTTPGAIDNSLALIRRISEESKSFDEPKPPVIIPELQPMVIDEVHARVSLHENNSKQGQISHQDESHINLEETFPSGTIVEGGERRTSLQGSAQPAFSCSHPDNDNEAEQLLSFNGYPSSKDDLSEGAGISVLLTRSSSSKGPVVQGRTFVASSITYNDLSYTRDSALRSSIGHGSTSTSSSIDFSSARQVQRQLSGKKSDMENYRHDRSHNNGSSFSGPLNLAHQALGLAPSIHEENIEICTADIKYDSAGETPEALNRKVHALENKEKGVPDVSLTSVAAPGEELIERQESSGRMDASASDLSFHTIGIQLEENPVASFPNESRDGSSNNARSVLDVEASAVPPDPCVEAEHTSPNGDGDIVAEVPKHRSLTSISEIETENDCQSAIDSENDDISRNSKSSINESPDPSVPTPSDKDITTSVLDWNNSSRTHGVLESTVMIEHQGGSMGRSLTLEEATDTILFCSSIVHDIANQAATLAIEKENSDPLEDCRPTVTIPEKPSRSRNDPPRSRTTGKRASKSQKIKQKSVETDVEPLCSKSENDENVNNSMVQNVGVPDKMDSAKPPKLESKCNCTIM